MPTSIRAWRRNLAALALLAVFSLHAVAADVYVIHGIPGADLGLDPHLPVDVQVDGACALEGFTFRQTAGPLALAAGTYDIAISLANQESPCGNDPVIAARVPFEDDETATVIAHLDESGSPTASKFVNDVSPAEDHQGRLVLRHTAAVGAVDAKLRGIYPYGRISVDGLANGEQAGVVLSRGLYLVRLLPAGGRHAVFGPVILRIQPGTAYFVHAVGSLESGSFTLITQTLGLATDSNVDVTVIHGIPGQDLGVDPALPVDVAVNGGCALPAFTFKTVAGPLSLPAGDYSIAISRANNETPCSNEPVIATEVILVGGENVTLIAHLDAAGAPTASAFINDTSRPRWGRARIGVRHTAAAGPVDVELQRKSRWRYHPLVIEDLMNTEEAVADVWRGRYSASIFPAAGDTPVFGPAKLKLRRSKATYVYAVGSPANGSFTVITQQVPTRRH